MAMGVDELHQMVDQRLDGVDTRLDRIDGKLTGVAEGAARLGAMIEVHDKRREAEIAAIFAALRERAQRGDLDDLRRRVDAANEQISSLRVNVAKLMVLVAVIAATVGGTAGGAVQMIARSWG
ncbi:MAG TPA: hypothetical protein PKC49_03480 [Phycisphaerae bacterium]|nr:hypothetical protein [Phycisphaerae bacterium]